MKHSSLTKVCQTCKKAYGPGTRRPWQYRISKYCSRACFGLADRNNLEKVLLKVVIDPTNNCHVWTGERNDKGYGRIKVGQRRYSVHRYIWEQIKGPIPGKMQLDHTCKNRGCCNVDHLRVVTPLENTLGENSDSPTARNFRKKVCPKCGGPYSFFPNGLRYCHPCRHSHMMEYQRQRRARLKKEKKLWQLTAPHL